MGDWNFLTNHGRALLCIASDPGVRLREVAERLGITERTAYGIVNDLATDGYVNKIRDGRRNRYEIQTQVPIVEPAVRDVTVGDVLEIFLKTASR